MTGHETSKALQRSYVLYAVGISCWMTLIACLGYTYMHPLLPADTNYDIYVISQQAAYVLSYFAFFVLGWNRKLESPFSFCKISAVALAGSIGLFGLIAIGESEPLLIVICGLLTGVGITSGYMQWTRLVVEQSRQEILSLLFIASIALTISETVFAFIPTAIQLYAFGILVIISLLLMFKTTTQTELKRMKFAVKSRNDAASQLKSSMLIPIVCSVVLVLVAPIAGTTYINTLNHDTFRAILTQIANAATLAILAIIFFKLKRRVQIFDAYCVFLPILASSILISAFFDPSQRWFVLFLGDMCFCAISFLILLTTCEISQRLNIPSPIVYGLLGGFVYLARIPEMFRIIDLGFAPETLIPFATVALLLYILAIPAFFLPFFNRKAKRDWNHLTSAFTTSDVNALCESLALRYHLPPRHAEVLKLLAAGHSIAHIAKTLCLSENTVKTYRKAIYAALDIHSRQALLDLVHNEIES